MDKMNLILDVTKQMLKVAEDLRFLSDSVHAVCNTIMEGLSEETKEKATLEKKEVKISLEKKEVKISLEKVRGVLAAKSQAGYSAEVRSIVSKYGASKLSEIDPKNYAEVLKDAEVIGNE